MVIDDISERGLIPTPTTAVVVGDAALALRATGRHRRRGEPPHSDEIGGFCDLSYLGEIRCFQECSFALQAASLVF